MNICDQIYLYKYICPDKIAIKSENESLTYNDLNISINMIANGLLSKSIREGCKVAILLNNSIKFLEIFLGASKAGWTVIVLDPKWSSKEIDYVLEKSKPELTFTEDELVHRVDFNEKSMDLIIVNKKGGRKEENRNLNDFTDWVIRNSKNNPQLKHDNPILLIGFTSGTTGKPKGYLRSHETWFESFYSTNYEFGINFNDVVIAPGPLVHSLSLYAAIHALFIGATFYLVDKFSPHKLISVLNKVEDSVIYMVPSMTHSVIDCIKKDRINFNPPKILISAGSKWLKSSKNEVKYYFEGVKIFEFYGSSEASFITLLDPKGNNLKPESVGRAFKNVRISIRDEEGNEVGVNEVGKLFVSSNMIFSGYYDDQLEAERIIKDGWLEMEDYAKMDDDGFVFIVGRSRNMIISGGLNVFPEEIEKILLTLEEVEETMVTGILDKYWGEKIVALIKWKENQQLHFNEIKAYCKKYLSAYKVPQEIISVKEFPYTNSGKIARGKIDKKLSKERLK